MSARSIRGKWPNTCDEMIVGTQMQMTNPESLRRQLSARYKHTLIDHTGLLHSSISNIECEFALKKFVFFLEIL
jgi:hypothetical protein